MKKFIATLIIFCLVIFVHQTVTAQNNKQVTRQWQTWISINSTFKLNDKYSILADAHIRRTDLVNDPSFYLLRAALAYNFNKNVLVAAGYAHLWIAPTTAGWKTYANENRAYEQIQVNIATGKINMLQRVRNEQRWQQKIVNDTYTGTNNFTNRTRYLTSFTIPVSNKANMPALVISDEIALQFGKTVTYNTFDQNRLFIGIKQKINKHLSFDLGYMNVYQQRASGYQYNLNNTLRCFFYYSGKLFNSSQHSE